MLEAVERLEPAVPPWRRILGAAAVFCYWLAWSKAAQNAQFTLGPVFRDLVGALGLVPIVVLIYALGPRIGFRKNAWVLTLIPFVGAFFMAGALYRTAILPHRPWMGTTIPYKWTRGWIIAPAVGLVLGIGFVAYDVTQQEWPITRDASRALAEEIDKSRVGPYGKRAKPLMTLHLGDQFLAVVEVADPLPRSEPQVWRFEQETRLGIRSWKIQPPINFDITAGIPGSHLRCQSGDRGLCLARLPKNATGFEVVFASGSRGAGLGRDGWGIAIVEPGASVESFRAFDRSGRILKEYPSKPPLGTQPADAPQPNIRGADIHLVSDKGGFEPNPVVLPSTPRDLVIDDCEGFSLFDVPDLLTDRQSGKIVLHWTEHGNISRSLTILADGQSCRSHERIARFLRRGF